MVKRFARAMIGGAATLAAVSLALAESPSGAEAAAQEQIAAILDLDADTEYGAYLAGDCVTCHRRGGGEGIPPIAGLPAEHTVRALVEYRLKLRDNEVMTVRAARLSDEEIAALAAHFADRTP